MPHGGGNQVKLLQAHQLGVAHLKSEEIAAVPSEDIVDKAVLPSVRLALAADGTVDARQGTD